MGMGRRWAAGDGAAAGGAVVAGDGHGVQGIGEVREKKKKRRKRKEKEKNKEKKKK